ncbi:MAG: nitroreductase family deazaflavin-dependent oxidoreductase [bacterium]|nr:nitroreductase family deazaflavin-dependent oxidoreductase [bacterium]
MPLPKLLARVNKRTFNKMEIKKGVRPTLTHVGRKSGMEYKVPLDAHAVAGGYIFILMYGADSDWVRNILVAGTARLTIDGKEIDLVSPRVINTEAAWAQLPTTAKAPPGFAKVTEYLQMDTCS